MANKNVIGKKNKKRTVDNWKRKKWYTITADPLFDNKEIGKTVALDGKNIVNRIVKKTLNEITNNIRDSNYILSFRINKVVAGNAETELIQLNTKPAFIKRIARRRTSKIENIIFVETKDNKKLKLKIVFISGKRYTTPLKREARNQIKDFYTTEIKNQTLREAFNSIVYQKYTDKAKKMLVKLGYVRTIIIAKAKLL
jgi:ribosomal protein S3AE